MSRYDIALNKAPKKSIKRTVKKAAEKIFNKPKSELTQEEQRALARPQPQLTEEEQRALARPQPQPRPYNPSLQGEQVVTDMQGVTGTQGWSGTIMSPSSMDQDQRGRRTQGFEQERPTSLNSQTPITPSSDGRFLEGNAPPSVHLTITGPGGYRVFIPMRNLDARVEEDRFIVRMSSQTARSLMIDIESWRRNRDGQI